MTSSGHRGGAHTHSGALAHDGLKAKVCGGVGGALTHCAGGCGGSLSGLHQHSVMVSAVGAVGTHRTALVSLPRGVDTRRHGAVHDGTHGSAVGAAGAVFT